MNKTQIRKLLTEKTMCISCYQCEIVCSIYHFAEVNPRRSRIRIMENTIKGTSTPMVCHQCIKPACVHACQESAITQNKESLAVNIDSEKCTGCMACIEGCPFHAIFIDEQTNLPLVCDLCGGNPMCAQFCHVHPAKPYAAINFVACQEMSEIRKKPVPQS